MIAENLLSHTIIPLRTSDSGEEALGIMNDFYVRHLPIVNDKQLLGMIAEDEILEYDIEENGSEFLFDFDLLTTHVDKMKSLFNLDKDEDIFTLYIGEKGINIKGTSYDATLCHSYDSNVEKGAKVVIYKKYINLLDKENYKVSVCENKVVFKSLELSSV